ncbi:MAG: MFS transporter, partial [Pseudomonadota bacterium]
MIRPVPLIVLAQLFGTSLWFSANGVGDALMRDWVLTPADLGILTAAVQSGFILGTLLFAVSGLADR